MKNIENLSHKDFFFCYTKILSDYLKGNGIPYLLKAKSIKNGNTFTVYAKTNQLQELLSKYKEN